MGTVMKSHLGKINVLEANPRSIRDSAFSSLVESLERDPEFLMTRGVVVWQVPTKIDLPEGSKSPFVKQLGKLVVLGGNMRCNALKALGIDVLRPEWVVEAKDEKGNWWSVEKAERFVLIDNSQPGNSGENDYQLLVDHFNETIMRQSGVDFSEFQEMISAGTIAPFDGKDEEGDTETDRVEKDDLHGEKSEELQAFISEREKTRAQLKEIDEAGFHLLLVFEDGFREKCEFISKAGVFGGTVSVDGGPYLDLVFETYDQKVEFLEKSGLLDENMETGVPAVMYGLFCDGRAFAKKMGIELKESGVHNRDRKVDHQLAEMAMEPQKQMTEKEIEESLFAKLRAERAELGMPTGEKKGKKGGKSAPRPSGAEERAPRKGRSATPDTPEDEAGAGMYVADEAFEDS